MAGYLHSRKPPGHIPLRKRGEEHLAEMFPEASSSAVAWSGSIGAIQFWLAALFVWCTRERRRETAKATPQRQPVSKHLGWLQTSAPRMHFIIVNLDVFCEKEREGIVRTGVVCTQPTAQKTFLSTGFSRPPSAICQFSQKFAQKLRPTTDGLSYFRPPVCFLPKCRKRQTTADHIFNLRPLLVDTYYQGNSRFF